VNAPRVAPVAGEAREPIGAGVPAAQTRRVPSPPTPGYEGREEVGWSLLRKREFRGKGQKRGGRRPRRQSWARLAAIRPPPRVRTVLDEWRCRLPDSVTVRCFVRNRHALRSSPSRREFVHGWRYARGAACAAGVWALGSAFRRLQQRIATAPAAVAASGEPFLPQLSATCALWGQR